MKLNEKEALRYLGFRGKPADADTDEIHAVYRRKDGSYGVLIPER